MIHSCWCAPLVWTSTARLYGVIPCRDSELIRSECHDGLCRTSSSDQFLPWLTHSGTASVRHSGVR